MLGHRTGPRRDPRSGYDECTVIKIPITREIIDEGRNRFPESLPVVEAILRGLDGAQDVARFDEAITAVAYADGQVVEYENNLEVGGWMHLFWMGEDVPTGELWLRTYIYDDRVLKQTASFEEDDGQPTVRASYDGSLWLAE